MSATLYVKESNRSTRLIFPSHRLMRRQSLLLHTSHIHTQLNNQQILLSRMTSRKLCNRRGEIFSEQYYTSCPHYSIARLWPRVKLQIGSKLLLQMQNGESVNTILMICMNYFQVFLLNSISIKSTHISFAEFFSKS